MNKFNVQNCTEHEMGNEGKKLNPFFGKIYRTFVDLKSENNYLFHVD